MPEGKAFYSYIKPCEHVRSDIFRSIFLKFGQNICLKIPLTNMKMVAWITLGLGGIITSIVKPCEHSRSHTFCPLLMKFTCNNQIRKQFLSIEKHGHQVVGAFYLKLLYWKLVNTQSRNKIVYPKFMKWFQNMAVFLLNLSSV